MPELAALALGVVLLVPLAASKHARTSPGAMNALAWGVVCLLGGMSVVRYNPVTWSAIGGVALYVSAFYAGILLGSLTSRRATRLRPAPARHDDDASLVRLAGWASLLVIVGALARYYHVVVVNQRPFLTDLVQTYALNIDSMPGSNYSRIGYLLFLWPVPASVLVWRLTHLSSWTKLLLGVGATGQIWYVLLSGGRSGFFFTALFLLMAWGAAIKAGAWKGIGRRQRLAASAAVGASVALFAVLIVVIYGYRSTDVRARATFTESYELHPVLRKMTDAAGISVAAEGIVGSLGYASQPLQRLGLFFDMDFQERFYGAWNFGPVGKFVGKFGDEARQGRVRLELATAYILADTPFGTFSTAVRDYYLDFGLLGVTLGAALLGYGGQVAYRQLLRTNRIEYLPLVGCFGALIGTAPLFSGLQLAGANYTLAGCVIAFTLLRRATRPATAAATPRPVWRPAEAPVLPAASLPERG